MNIVLLELGFLRFGEQNVYIQQIQFHLECKKTDTIRRNMCNTYKT